MIDDKRLAELRYQVEHAGFTQNDIKRSPQNRIPGLGVSVLISTSELKELLDTYEKRTE